MATFEMRIPDEKIQEMLQGDRGMEVLLEPILNQILQAEMTDHLQAGREERIDDRHGYRNGTDQRSEHVPTAVGEGIGDDANADGGARRLHTPNQKNHH